MSFAVRTRRPPEAGFALTLSVLAAAVYWPLATFGPGWWHGTTLPDMDPPFDLGWLHDSFAWTAATVGPVLVWLFAATALLMLILIAMPRPAGTAAGPSLADRLAAGTAIGAGAALMAVPGLAVGWLALTQVSGLIAPIIGMYHGHATPAVP